MSWGWASSMKCFSMGSQVLAAGWALKDWRLLALLSWVLDLSMAVGRLWALDRRLGWLEGSCSAVGWGWLSLGEVGPMLAGGCC